MTCTLLSVIFSYTNLANWIKCLLYKTNKTTLIASAYDLHSSITFIIPKPKGSQNVQDFQNSTVYPAYGDVQLNEVATLPPENAPIKASIAE
jgi:hypothetical protein